MHRPIRTHPRNAAWHTSPEQLPVHSDFSTVHLFASRIFPCRHLRFHMQQPPLDRKHLCCCSDHVYPPLRSWSATGSLRTVQAPKYCFFSFHHACLRSAVGAIAVVYGGASCDFKPPCIELLQPLHYIVPRLDSGTSELRSQ